MKFNNSCSIVSTFLCHDLILYEIIKPYGKRGSDVYYAIYVYKYKDDVDNENKIGFEMVIDEPRYLKCEYGIGFYSVIRTNLVANERLIEYISFPSSAVYLDNRLCVEF